MTDSTSVCLKNGFPVKKNDRNCIFILKPTQGRRIKGIVRSDIHGWALSEEAIQSPNHEQLELREARKKIQRLEM
ncbi:hypothetical protein EWM60_20605, partial [Candidatus Erwinia dacicola]|nr:hypothetical protein [Candidatus Erwinia dacicola]